MRFWVIGPVSMYWWKTEFLAPYFTCKAAAWSCLYFARRQGTWVSYPSWCMGGIQGPIKTVHWYFLFATNQVVFSQAWRFPISSLRQRYQESSYKRNVEWADFDTVITRATHSLWCWPLAFSCKTRSSRSILIINVPYLHYNQTRKE